MTERQVRRSILDPLAEQILGMIRERRLQAGDPIPTELELIEHLSVSRNTVREAIRILRTLGIVDVRHGHGTFVGEAALQTLSPSLTFQVLANKSGDSLQGLRDLVDVRELVETGVVAKLAGCVTQSTLDRLDELCDRMAETGLGPDVDREFHRTLCAALGNPMIGQLLDLFWDSYHAASAILALPGPAHTDRAVVQHRAIVSTLENGDAEAARTVMSAHFDEIKHRLAVKTDSN